VVAHFTGRGAAELVRFWGEPPLVREPDITLFGIERLDPPEQEFLNKSPMRLVLAEDIQRAGAEKAAKDALEHLHASERQFVLHFDTDVIAQEDFGAVPVPGPGGLRLNEVRDSLRVFAASKNLLAIDVVEFNPEKDPDGSKAKLLVDLLGEVLAARLEALAVPAPAPEPAAETPETSSTGTTA
jgi:arginase family enzyme